MTPGSFDGGEQGQDTSAVDQQGVADKVSQRDQPPLKPELTPPERPSTEVLADATGFRPKDGVVWRFGNGNKGEYGLLYVTKSEEQPYVRCLQVRFSLVNPSSKQKFFVTRWESALTPKQTAIKASKFEYQNPPGATLFLKILGEFFGADKLKLSLEAKDDDPKVMAETSLAFEGKPGALDLGESFDAEFCGRCFGKSSCAP